VFLQTLSSVWCCTITMQIEVVRLEMAPKSSGGMHYLGPMDGQLCRRKRSLEYGEG